CGPPVSASSLRCKNDRLERATHPSQRCEVTEKFRRYTRESLDDTLARSRSCSGWQSCSQADWSLLFLHHLTRAHRSRGRAVDGDRRASRAVLGRRRGGRAPGALALAARVRESAGPLGWRRPGWRDRLGGGLRLSCSNGSRSSSESKWRLVITLITRTWTKRDRDELAETFRRSERDLERRFVGAVIRRLRPRHSGVLSSI